MKCPSCGRKFSEVKSFPVTCSCLAKFGEDGGLIERSIQPIPANEPKPTIASPEPVGTAMAEAIPKWSLSMKGGCQCRDWELKMNRWGRSGCEARRGEIVNHLVSQGKHLIPALAAVPDAIKRIAANRMLDHAIKRSTEIAG